MKKDNFLSGAEMIVQKLWEHGIRRIYNFPGGTITPVFAAIEKFNLKKGKIEIITPRNEQGAGYAALAEAKVTGKTTVWMVTSGPGVTNAITPLADFYYDSVPGLLITGQVSTDQMLRNKRGRQMGFQEVPTVDICSPITKKSFLAEDTAALPLVIDEAFYLTVSGRKGPVVIDLPMDVQFKNLKINEYSKSAINKTEKVRLDHKKISAIARAILYSKRPVIIAGWGVISANGCEELFSLSCSQNIPVAMTLSGIGAFPGTHRLSLGRIGYAGSRFANLALFEADLIIAIGTSLHIRQTGTETQNFAPLAKIIHIDIDKGEIGKRIRVDFPLQADAKDALIKINKLLRKKGRKKPQVWLSQIQEWQKRYPLSYQQNLSIIKPQYAIECFYQTARAVSKKLGKEIILTTGVGQHQLWATLYFPIDKPQTFLTSAGHGTMGFGEPAAIGAQIAKPNALVLCITGDGSFQMNIQELATISTLKLPIKILILNNNSLGLVAQFQNWKFGRAIETINRINPNFAAVAESYNIKGYQVRKLKELTSIYQKALSFPGPAVIDCFVDPKEEVKPMLMSGKALNEMWPYDDIS